MYTQTLDLISHGTGRLFFSYWAFIRCCANWVFDVVHFQDFRQHENEVRQPKTANLTLVTIEPCQSVIVVCDCKADKMAI